jgi:hypothetical protein
MKEPFSINQDWSKQIVDQVLADLQSRKVMQPFPVVASNYYRYRGDHHWSIELPSMQYHAVFIERDCRNNKLYLAFMNPIIHNGTFQDYPIYAFDLDKLSVVSLAIGMYLTKAAKTLACEDWVLGEFISSYPDLFQNVDPCCDSYVQRVMMGFGDSVLSLPAELMRAPYNLTIVSGD